MALSKSELIRQAMPDKDIEHLRDYFAGQAMAGVIAQRGYFDIARCYEIAEEMLIHRAKLKHDFWQRTYARLEKEHPKIFKDEVQNAL